MPEVPGADILRYLSFVKMVVLVMVLLYDNMAICQSRKVERLFAVSDVARFVDVSPVGGAEAAWISHAASV
jgi:hypothetical protein